MSNSPRHTVAGLAAAIGGHVEGNGDLEITGPAPIESAGPSQISFVANPLYKKHLETTRAGALVLDQNTPWNGAAIIRHQNPYLAFAGIVDLLCPDIVPAKPGIDPTATVDPSAKIDPAATIGPLCHIEADCVVGRGSWLLSSVFVGRGSRLGEQNRIYPGVRMMHGTRLGNRVILHAGVVLGSDGFGFAPSPGGLKKIRQVGWVEVGDDVEIGANTTVDRGAIGPTRIGRGTKIDNLVQIAHNVEIGQDCLIVAQVGISGSTKIGNRVILAGQVGLVGHIEIGDDVKVGAQSGVPHSIPAGKVYFGYPAREAMETKRIEASLRRLPELLKRVKQLEDELARRSGGQ